MDPSRVRSLVAEISNDEPDAEVCELVTQMADDLLYLLIQTAATKAEQRGSQEVELRDLESVASEWKIDPTT
jgi:hypothetical protein